ncbi:MAG: hypothetical protein LBB53_04945 [Prevotellaceae bacterium]|jgi:hypothetical protein|nr:hypothetical protein [Prevotellaceae bacterium]
MACSALTMWFLSMSVGYNIVKYCCSNCEMTEIAFCENKKNSANDDCCGGFAHKESSCTKEQKTEEHCFLGYFKANFPAFEHPKNLKIEPKVFDLPIILEKNFSTKKIFENTSFLKIPQKSPPCGRHILSQKSVLII